MTGLRVGVLVVPDATDPDAWTLLSFLAARTEPVRLVPDVASLPLRPPAMLAKAAASLDAIEGMGGPRRTPGESVDALEEAIAVLRGWFGGERSVRLDGRHHRLSGARPGPAPAHPIELWMRRDRPARGRLGRRSRSAKPLLAEAFPRCAEEDSSLHPVIPDQALNLVTRV